MYLKINKFWGTTLLLFVVIGAVNAQVREKVGSNSMAISPSAVFEIESTTQGFLPPRMTKAQMLAIANPVEGLMVYCTTCSVNSIFAYSGTDWLNLVNGLFDPFGAVGSYVSKASAGTMVVGSAVTGVTQTITANVSQVGTYSISTITSNGIIFAGSGSYSVTGTQDVILTASGTPSAAGTFSHDISGIPTVRFSRNVLGTVTSSTNKIWLDKNLGAAQVATSSTDAASYGDLYQWGRGKDGHQIRTSGTTSTLSNNDQPNNPNFILAPSSPSDWRSGQNNNLWQGVNGINNPCPVGFRVPTSAELSAESATFSPQYAPGAFNSVLKLPMAGGRVGRNGSLFNVGSNGYYWSSTVSGTNASYLYFFSGDASVGTYTRADGLSVRCLKD